MDLEENSIKQLQSILFSIHVSYLYVSNVRVNLFLQVSTREKIEVTTIVELNGRNKSSSFINNWLIFLLKIVTV